MGDPVVVYVVVRKINDNNIKFHLNFVTPEGNN